jgi:hypothetical protein
MKSKSEHELSRRIKREIMRRLGKNMSITLQDFAKVFAVSTRSLQLKLQEKGTSFSRQHEDDVQPLASTPYPVTVQFVPAPGPR